MDPALQVAIVTSGFGFAAVALAEVRQFRQNRRLTQIQHQVQNSHETNLREDLDKVIEGIDTLVEGQRRHDGEISGIRDDLRVERQERLAMASLLQNATRHNLLPQNDSQ